MRRVRWIFGVHLNLAYGEVIGGYAVTYDPVGDAVSAVDVSLPIYASLAGVDVNQGPDARIDVAGHLFLVSESGRGTSGVSVSSANLASFVPFVNLRVSDIQDKLESLRDEFLATVAVSDNFNVAIPFIDASLADVIDLGAAFDLAVLSKLDFGRMDSLQDFADAVTAAGLLAPGEAVTYNPTSRTLAIPLDFDIDLGGLSLRDLDVLGRITVGVLAEAGLIQVGDYVDPDDLLDDGYATLAALWAAGVLNVDSVADWTGIDTAALIDSGVVGDGALVALGLIEAGNLVDMDELIDKGLVTLGDLAEAGLITPASLVASLGFIRDINLAATNVADLGFDLTSQASIEDLVNLDELLEQRFDDFGEPFRYGAAGPWGHQSRFVGDHRSDRVRNRLAAGTGGCGSACGDGFPFVGAGGHFRLADGDGDFVRRSGDGGADRRGGLRADRRHQRGEFLQQRDCHVGPGGG